METQRIYQEKIQNNPSLSSHNLLGYIDKKLSNPDGEIVIDMSNLQHPYEMTQIENLNKIDEAKYLAEKLENFIEQDDFQDEDEK